MTLCDPVHGAGVTQGAGLLLAGIALDQGVDHLALHRRSVSGQTPRVTCNAQACGDRFGVAAAAIQVRPDRPGLAPGAHAARRVQLPRLPERPHRFRMLERPAQSHAVVEPGLGLEVVRVDRKTLVAEARGHDHVACRLDIADGPDPAADLRIGDQGQGRRRRCGVGDRHGRNQTGDRNCRDPQTLAHLRPSPFGDQCALKSSARQSPHQGMVTGKVSCARPSPAGAAIPSIRARKGCTSTLSISVSRRPATTPGPWAMKIAAISGA